MYIGEKLTAISNIVYDLAKRQFDEYNLDSTAAEFIMRDIHRRFLENAYNSSLIRQLSETTNNESKQEQQDETQDEK